jgi:SAM-dependent MidA family methyltransferase
LENAPKDRKLRILELGSGRGGMARTIAKSLLEKNMLELMYATNISEVENRYNEDHSSEFGENYKVAKISFDHLFDEGAFK